MKGELAKWRLRKSCTKKELLSLIGQLNHAAKVIRPGRTFLRRLIDLSCSVSCLHHHIRLNVSARSDIAWWSTFCEEWNGVGLFISPSPAASVHTDAAGNWGCGAMWSSHWFQIKWPADWLSLNIAIKELLPIVVAAATWGSFWRGSQVLCFSDNMSVVHAICSRSVRNPQLMRLLRALFFVEAHFNMSLGARHVAGVSNTAADALSRDNVDLFRLSAPQADAHPSPPPRVCFRFSSTSKRTGHPPAAQRYFELSLSSSTTRSYKSAQSRYLNFCSRFSLAPFPLSETLLCSFATFLAQEGLRYQSIKCYLSALRHAQIASGFPDPRIGSNHPRLEAILRGIKRSQAPLLTFRLAPAVPLPRTY